MRLVTVRLDERRTFAARVDDGALVELPFDDVGMLLASEDWRRVAASDGPRHAYEPTRLAAVVPRPPKIWCVGMNYAAHAAEAHKAPPAHPMLFAKFSNALIGPNDPIALPVVSKEVDWEAELAIVISRPGERVSVTNAGDYIAGYTVINDVSMRDWQRRTPQYLQGKTFGKSTPLGPELVTLDELPDSAQGLAVTCSVNGEVVQSGSTNEMIFSVEELVSYVSDIAPLEPGDVIASGTPSGIGALMKPPRFLQDGDVLETEIEGVGWLRNSCTAEQPSSRS